MQFRHGSDKELHYKRMAKRMAGMALTDLMKKDFYGYSTQGRFNNIKSSRTTAGRRAGGG
jgi:hypothetical protein